MRVAVSIAQGAALMLLGILVGSMFAIWMGYPILAYSAATFVEVHQQAVRGLNVTLPLTGLVVLLLVAFLAYAARRRRRVLALYAVVALLVVAGGLVTRFYNQPINAEVMTWTAATLPPDWSALRESWWMWHQVRLAITALGEIILIVAIFAHRRAPMQKGKADKTKSAARQA